MMGRGDRLIVDLSMLEQQRLRAGLSRKELAVKAAVSLASVNRLFRLRRSGFHVCRAVVTALELTLDQVVIPRIRGW